ncbi:hypothetical protein PR202_ga13407 [Eleusine coracana subsp. coracana]|uniref:Uncharacterized protein n=1 Tax=Eleusine coracana subsp. coracana TaxID=191504 RepID=A0AAV5CEM1_ELECO|nr:hypothetical protein PR202_ga13407 [Eleusine coracana subsp. coracana]
MVVASTRSHGRVLVPVAAPLHARRGAAAAGEASPEAQGPATAGTVEAAGDRQHAHHLVNVLPHRALNDLARVHGPLMMLRLGQTPLVVASSKEPARAVLKTHATNFATRPKLLAGEIVGYEWADILFSPSGDYWRKLRQLCAAEILSPKRVLSFRHIREDEVRSSYE